jgi:hypothetical protein
MPKYLIRASLAKEATKGVIKEGGSKHRVAVEQTVKGLGGSSKSTSPSGKMAVSMAINSSGIVAQMTTVLVTPEEVDQAKKMAN